MTGSAASRVASRQCGFTIVELMVVVAIISILAVVALPAYQGYTVRAKMTEVLARGAASRTAVSEWYSSNGRFPSVAASAPFDTGSSGKVRSVEWDPTVDQVVLTVSATGTDPAVYGTTVMIRVTSTVNRIVVWKCETGTIAQKYLPSSCQ